MMARTTLAVTVAVLAAVVAAWSPVAQGKVLLRDEVRVSEEGWTAVDFDADYDPSSDRYLVVWNGAGEGLFGRILDGAARTVGKQFRIADGGSRDVVRGPPGEFFVLSAERVPGSTGTCRLAGRRLGPNGGTIGAPFVVSESGCGGGAAVYNPAQQEYLVTWNMEGIHGQRLATGGTRVGTEGFRISDSSYPYLGSPEVAHNPVRNEYLVLWDQPRSFYKSVYGQCLDAAGAQIGANDFLIKPIASSPDEPTEYVWLRGLHHDPGRGEFVALLGAPARYHQAAGFPRSVFGCSSDKTGGLWAMDCCAGSGGLIAGSFDLAENRLYGTWSEDQDPAAFETRDEIFAGPLEGGRQVSNFGRSNPNGGARGSMMVYNERADEHLVVFTGYEAANDGVKVFARRIGRPPDRRAPRVTLSAKRRQQVVRRRAVVLRVRCDEHCDFVASSTSTGRTRVKGFLSAREHARIKLELSRSKVRFLRRALRRRDSVRVRITVTAKDRAGNSATATRSIRATR